MYYHNIFSGDGNRMRSERGFTLVEIIVALIGAIIVLCGVYLVYLMGLRSWEEGSLAVNLERSAGIIMDKIARGVNGRFGLREADIGTVQVSGDGRSVTYMVDKHDPPTVRNSDDTTSRYYQAGSNVWYDPNVSVAGDTIRLNRCGSVEALNFSQSGNVFTVTLSMSGVVPRITGRRQYVRMATRLLLRKAR